MNAGARYRFRFILLAIAFALIATHGNTLAQSQTDVQIDAMKIVGTTLTITGRNFGTGAPAVLVADATAAVSSHTSTEIVAETPALARGRYAVTVMRDSNAGGTAVSSLIIK